MAQDNNAVFGGEIFKKAWDEQVAKGVEGYETGVKELSKLQAQGVEQSQKAIDEWARIARESFAQGVAVQTQLRDASLEALRKLSGFAVSKLPARQAPPRRHG